MSEYSKTGFQERSNSSKSVDEDFFDESNFEDFESNITKFVCFPTSIDRDLSEEMQEEMVQYFSKSIVRSSTSLGPPLNMDSFDNVLKQSTLSLTNRLPLLIYLYRKTINQNIFWDQTICSEPVTDFLKTNFLIWPWDITNERNYLQFLKLLLSKCGPKEVSHLIDHLNPHALCPTLVCISSRSSQLYIQRTIDTTNIIDENNLIDVLCAVQEECTSSSEEEYCTRNDQDLPNNRWYIPNSILSDVPELPSEIPVITDLNISTERISRIQKIENPLWFIQYSTKKRSINDRLEYCDEKVLYYGCILSMAKDILGTGFQKSTNQIHGNQLGYGFYFSSIRTVFENYRLSKEQKCEKRALIICKVLVGKTCMGEPTMMSCPDGYDSTTDGSTTYVIYCNEQILPQYLVTYVN